MTYRLLMCAAGAGLALAGAMGPAMAQQTYVPLQAGTVVDAPGHHHRVRHHRARHHRFHGVDRGFVTLGYGDTIISGRTGQHRSIVSGVMVPDSDPPDVVLTGRATGSGPGANGFPGSNQ